VFLPKSAESHENKGVEFCRNAKKRKRVRKELKRKGIVHQKGGNLKAGGQRGR
jgi:hypothetical protein